MKIPESLEFPRLLEAVAQHAGTLMAHEWLLELEPFESPELLGEEIRLLERYQKLAEEGAPAFYEVGDPRHVLRILATPEASADIDGLLRLQHSLTGMRSIRKWFDDRANRTHETAAIADRITPREDLEKLIGSIILPDARIRDDASSELKRIRRELLKLDGQVRETLETVLREWAAKGALQEHLITIRDGHYVLPVQSNYRHKVGGVVLDTSGSGNTVYVEPYAVIELNNKLNSLLQQEAEEISRILAELSANLHPHVPEILESIDAIVTLDAGFARAAFGIAMHGCIAALSPSQELHLRDARHPLLQLRIGREKVIPLDVSLGENGGRVLLISGPNAGGKTVTLKTAGMALAMFMCGLPVVAGAAELPFISELFSIIGDDQSLEQDLSTFSAHLTSLEKTLHTRSSRKLILVDEICSGTDPTEGSALSQALLERWRDDGCFVVCTTHQSSLKLFVQETHGMINGAMAFDEAELRPTFRFRIGAPGSSYALAIAARVKFPSELRNRAKELLGDRTVQVETLLEELANLREQASAAAKQAERAQSDAAHFLELATNDRAQAKQELAQAKRQAATLADDMLKEANRRIEGAVRQLREANASADAIKNAHQLIDQLREELRDRSAPSPDSKKKSQSKPAPSIKILSSQLTQPNSSDESEDAPLKPGDAVRFRDSGNEAIVLAVGEDFIQVEAGSIKLRVSPDAIVRAKRSKHTATHRSMTVSIGASNKVDLRGMTREDAIDAIESFLADAAVEGWQQVEIIHGKGFGILKEATADVLRKHPLVKEWRVGAYGEGSGGATIVKMK